MELAGQLIPTCKQQLNKCGSCTSGAYLQKAWWPSAAEKMCSWEDSKLQWIFPLHVVESVPKREVGWSPHCWHCCCGLHSAVQQGVTCPPGCYAGVRCNRRWAGRRVCWERRFKEGAGCNKKGFVSSKTTQEADWSDSPAGTPAASWPRRHPVCSWRLLNCLYVFCPCLWASGTFTDIEIRDCILQIVFSVVMNFEADFLKTGFFRKSDNFAPLNFSTSHEDIMLRFCMYM